MLVLDFSTHTMLIGYSLDVPGYKSSPVIIYDHIHTRKMCLPVRHWVTVAFLTPFFCVRNIVDTSYYKCMGPLL